MGFTAGKGVWIGSAYTLSVLVLLVLLRWWFRTNCTKQTENTEDADDSTSEVENQNTSEIGDGGSTSREQTLEPKHKVFLSHSGAQKDFVEQLCVDLERCDRYPFFDKQWDSLPIGSNFPKLIFEAIEQCEVGVVVLSKEFFTQSKWPMLELAAMVNNSKLVIIPVYLGISLEEVRDMQLQKEWWLIWSVWAKNNKKRINIKEWEEALKALGPLNSLIYKGDGKVSFRAKIVKAICEKVPPLSRWKECHIQGRHRLLKVVHGRIEQAKVSKRYGVPMVGIYGAGGIGKTTICHILCNEYLAKMQGRVFHAELGNASDLELLQGALKNLTNKSIEFVHELDESKCKDLLRRELGNQPIFLAIDNISDATKSVEQAKMFLEGGFAKGSIIIMTTRSFDVLEHPHLGVDGDNCLEMPELDEEDAKSLFMQHAIFDEKMRAEVDIEVIKKCLKRCYFDKGDGESYHYHPLALKVLGLQLGSFEYDKSKWEAMLKEVDTFNLRKEEHPIYSILRKSFDTLEANDQMLFMDVAIFLPNGSAEISWRYRYRKMSMTTFEWLSVVHSTSVNNIMERLKGLKRKWLLQEIGDGGSRSIGIHDLWREFANMELQEGKFENHQWALDAGESYGLEEGIPFGSCWQNMKKMCFLSEGVVRAKEINFEYYSNITVLKMNALTIDATHKLNGHFYANFSKLRYLKSLELEFPIGSEVQVQVEGLCLLKNLLFLRLQGGYFSRSTIIDVKHLTKLCYLVMIDSTNASPLDIHGLTCLKEMDILGYSKITTISGFGSKFVNLHTLDLSDCIQISRLDSGVGELVALQELRLRRCSSLHDLPNLQMLTHLEFLDISECSKIVLVPGIDDLVALKEFRAFGCKGITKFPNVQKLTLLKSSDISGCSTIELVPGLDDLVALKKFRASGCEGISKLPNLQKLTLLESLDISGCSKIELVPGLDDLVALKKFRASGCEGISKLPNLQKLTHLESLDISGCSKIELVPGLDDLVDLKKFRASGCKGISKLPNLQKLTLLESLYISGCSKIELVPGLDDLVALKEFWASGCEGITKLPNLQKLILLKSLEISGCSKIVLVPGIDDLVALKEFRAFGCKGITKFPNVQKLTLLKSSDISGCSKIELVPGLDDLVALKKFRASGCKGITKLQSLQKLTNLEYLDISGCSKIELVPSLDDLVALKKFRASGCEGISKLPNLQKLTLLESLDISGCSKIELVPGLDDLVALKKFRASGCKGISKLPNLQKLTILESLYISRCFKIELVPGLDDLVALREVWASGCEGITKLPNLHKLTLLKSLDISGCSKIELVPGLDDLVALKKFRASGCEGISKLPNLQKLTHLESLKISGCSKNKVVPGLDDLVALKEFWAPGCEGITKLPNLQKLTLLKSLGISGCSKIELVPGLDDLVALKEFWASGCERITKLPNLQKLTLLKSLDISGCYKIELVPGLDDLVALKKFRASGCEGISKLPNLQKLTHLESLYISRCFKIELVPGLDDLVALKDFWAPGCEGITKLPNLQKLTLLKSLNISGCSKIELVPGLDDLVALKEFWASGCERITKLPNLQKLTLLKSLDISGCYKIELVPGLDDLVALKKFRSSICKEITKLPNLPNLTHLESLDISGSCTIELVSGLDDLVASKEFRTSCCQEIGEFRNLQ